jgi:hypothetical protein
LQAFASPTLTLFLPSAPERISPLAVCPPTHPRALSRLPLSTSRYFPSYPLVCLLLPILICALSLQQKIAYVRPIHISLFSLFLLIGSVLLPWPV